MEKVEISQKEPKAKIELSDSDFAMFQTLQELAQAIKDLTKIMRQQHG